MESVTGKVPRAHQANAFTGTHRPGVSVNKRGIDGEDCDAQNEEFRHDDAADHRFLPYDRQLDTVEDEIERLRQAHDGKVESRKIMVQEQLAGHQIEGEVVERPAEYCCAQFVVETFDIDVLVVVEAALPAEEGDTLESGVNSNRSSR